MSAGRRGRSSGSRSGRSGGDRSRGPRRTSAPPPEHPDVWNALFDACDALRELAPWQWLTSAEVFGVQPAEADEISWIVVLGADDDEPRGLVSLPGEQGLRWHAAVDDGTLDPFDAPFSMSGLRVTFEHRDELAEETLGMHEGLGRRYPRDGWPEAVSFEAGRLPLLASVEEGRALSAVIRGAIEVARAARDAPGLLHGEELLVRRAGEDVRVPPPPPERPEPPPPPDELMRKRLARARQTDARWLGDHFSIPAIVDDGVERPFYARQLVWADAASGRLLGVAPAGPEAGAPELRAQLVQLAEKEGLPRQVVVRRAAVAAALEGLDERLEVLHEPDREAFFELYELIDSIVQQAEGGDDDDDEA